MIYILNQMLKEGMVVLLLTLSVLGSSCETKISLGDGKCTYYVTYPNNSCNSFTFQHCSYKLCTSRHKGFCQNYIDNQNTNWTSCGLECCDNTFHYPMTPQGIQMCQNYLNGSNYALVISLSIIIPLLLIAFIVVCFCFNLENTCLQRPQLCIQGCFASSLKNIYHCLRYYVWCKCLLRYQLNENPALEINQEKKRIGKQHSNVIWKISDEQNEELTKVCGICIKYGVSQVLNCGHVYHPRCLTAWLRKNWQCPKCESSINPVRVYCQSCATSYYQKDRDISLLSRQRQICWKCEESGVVNWIPE